MRVELFACRAALEARALQHLLVLLFAHSFAPLLNERSHGGATLAVRERLSETTICGGISTAGSLLATA
jgi:hypothetical protein